MPSSRMDAVPVIAQLVLRADPKSILDVGVGFGRWGVIFRELTDIRLARYDKSKWELVLKGIEAFEEYRNPLWQWVYDDVMVGDIRLYPELFEFSDLIFFGDVIEHMPKEDGQALLDAVTSAGKKYIVSTPTYDSGQGDEYMGNKFEIHVSAGQWLPTDFSNSTVVSGLLIGWNWNV